MSYLVSVLSEESTLYSCLSCLDNSGLTESQRSSNSSTILGILNTHAAICIHCIDYPFDYILSFLYCNAVSIYLYVTWCRSVRPLHIGLPQTICLTDRQYPEVNIHLHARVDNEPIVGLSIDMHVHRVYMHIVDVTR